MKSVKLFFVILSIVSYSFYFFNPKTSNNLSNNFENSQIFLIEINLDNINNLVFIDKYDETIKPPKNGVV
ncbi:hypothetical protein ED312_06945 [Sinomicrobium pectinilyticum]|uniref:Uncharacterized protein n=1 Tax=Sinomicrobium pectinilyticum TaxID=1084421 RepID=A0A3N0EPP0_SINP1|nr:hypothetical protein [Sinomicrobium pectinilyticum]RNL89850.1 hypothetical protein ED312_06945 [Sinomicrobium pectinilyticum]